MHLNAKKNIVAHTSTVSTPANHIAMQLPSSNWQYISFRLVSRWWWSH